MIYCGDLVVFYGDSGVGKMFVVFDFVFVLVQGCEWCGWCVLKCCVLYIGFEGNEGVDIWFKVV